jgi:hypothetical protein
MARYADAFTRLLWDDKKAQQLLVEASEIVAKAAKGKLDRDLIRTEPLTKAVIRLAGGAVKTARRKRPPRAV